MRNRSKKKVRVAKAKALVLDSCHQKKAESNSTLNAS